MMILCNHLTFFMMTLSERVNTTESNCHDVIAAPSCVYYGHKIHLYVIYDCIIWTMRMRNDVYILLYKCMLCCNCQSGD